MQKTDINYFRLIGILEGISYLILLFVAMPLKYFANMPLFVQIFGMAHGVLFIMFAIMLLIVWFRHRWSLIWVIGALVASLLPFGTFYLDSRLRKEYGPQKITIKTGPNTKI
ncbi:DUF3817 domain-containing protein [Bacillus sp. T33-2]|uniref:DUF3817 domain-containing protein n=1 Tax=Bacillus sp. T33-2 TaxID=2054168 RepID=UPI000C758558|nr:DUF3817 domain-containing protein [Bacillus sp. T33-2]PLR95128.1 hypothetical protein CVD19_15875 [Bacillus sp. T33-2]